MVLYVCREPRRQDWNSLDYAHRHALAVVFDHAEVADECPCNDAERPANSVRNAEKTFVMTWYTFVVTPPVRPEYIPHVCLQVAS